MPVQQSKVQPVTAHSIKNSNNTSDVQVLGGGGGIYSGPPFLCNIRPEIQYELDNRAKNRIRPITPFIKATPGFSFKKGDPEKVIFKGIMDTQGNAKDANTWKFTMKQLYRIEDGYRPPGGVTNLTVEYKNVTGAVRKAALSWVCHSLNDLERIGPYFLAPGRTMLIEYGWNDYMDLDKNQHYGSTYARNKGTNYTLASYYDIAQLDVLASRGNYDALLGIITNYDVSMNPDGGFTCVTHVTSVGDLMGGISMTQQHFSDKNLNPTDDSVPTLREFIEKNLDARLNYVLDSGLGKLSANGSSQAGIGTVKIDNRLGSFVSRFSDTRKTGIFMSWGYIEDEIINAYLIYKLDDNKYVEYDSSLSRIRTNEWLRTCDLNVCMIPVQFNDVYKLPEFTIPVQPDEPLKRRYGNPRNIMVNKEYFKDVFLKAKTVEEGITTLFGKINDACANLWRFSIRTRDEINRNDGKGPICIKEIVDLNYGGGHDLTMIQPYEFKIKSFLVKDKVGDMSTLERATGIIRNINLSTKLSNDAALNVFYSSTCKPEAGKAIPGSDNVFRSLWNYRKAGSDPTDDFAGKSDFPSNLDTRKIESDDEYAERILYETELQTKKAKEFNVIPEEYAIYGDQSGWTYDAMYYLPVKFNKVIVSSPYRWEWIPPVKEEATTLEKGREIMRSLFTYKKNGVTQEDPSTYEAVVPMLCEIELEGVSGIRAGDAFTVDNLPKLYKEKGIFQVVNITHEVSRETWKTKLKASFRVQRTQGKASEEISANANVAPMSSNTGQSVNLGTQNEQPAYTRTTVATSDGTIPILSKP